MRHCDITFAAPVSTLEEQGTQRGLEVEIDDLKGQLQHAPGVAKQRTNAVDMMDQRLSRPEAQQMTKKDQGMTLAMLAMDLGQPMAELLVLRPDTSLEVLWMPPVSLLDFDRGEQWDPGGHRRCK